MTWLLEGGREGLARQLKRLVSEGPCTAAPGVYDPLSALLARQAGFRALYLSGAALSASMGLPDLGIMTLDELVNATRRVVRATGLPVIVDGDTGYGEALNVMRTIRELEEAGAAAVQIEDQEMPKRCGHLEGKHLVPLGEMLGRLRAAIDARREMLIIARTDAAGVTGLADAIQRGHAYSAAGADVIFPEGLRNVEEFAAFRAAVPGPLLANMTEFGRSPSLTVGNLRDLGYELAIFPVSALRLAARAMADGYAALAAQGSMNPVLPKMFTRSELYELIRYRDHEDQSRQIQVTSATEEPNA